MDAPVDEKDDHSWVDRGYGMTTRPVNFSWYMEKVAITCSASLLSELRRSLSIFSLSSKSSLRDSLRASI